MLRRSIKSFVPVLWLSAVTKVSTGLSLSMSMSTRALTIDSHLHVWANREESSKFAFAEGQTPPDALLDKSCTSALLRQMSEADVDGALIVQPINHKFDHSYVAAAIAQHPSKLKGMLLHDPSLDEEAAVSRLEQLALQGFVGVRFNPYLWPDATQMSDSPAGLAVYKRCAELNMPVGVMCFKGLHLHHRDILNLLQHSPQTTLILDHFAFTALDDRGNDHFQTLLSLHQYPNVIVKISALFRVAAKHDSFPYHLVKTKRFIPLMETFGKDRLMFGTDFPFVMQQKEQYKGTVDLVRSWLDNDQDRKAVMGGTAQRVFGFWGKET